MSHKPGKPMSPERKYNATKKLDEEIRMRKMATKQQEQYLSVATWETNLGVKDVAAQQRWRVEGAKTDAALTNAKIKQVRHLKLQELYKQDEAIYTEELAQRGLAFCREKF